MLNAIFFYVLLFLLVELVELLIELVRGLVGRRLVDSSDRLRRRTMQPSSVKKDMKIKTYLL